MKYLPLLLFLLFLKNHAFPQAQPSPQKPEKDFDRVITYTQLWQEIIACEDTIYDLYNVLIQCHREYGKEVKELLKKNNVIKPYISISYSEFRGVIRDKRDIARRKIFGEILPVRMTLNNITFERMVSFYEIKNLKWVGVGNCIFKNGVEFSSGDNEIRHISIYNCKIEGGFMFDVSDSESDFSGRITLSNTSVHLKYSQSMPWYADQKGDGWRIPKISSKEPVESSFLSSNSSELHLYHSTFTTDTSLNWISIGMSGLKSLTIDSCTFETDLVLNNNLISEIIDIRDTKFKNISLSNVIFPPETNINFKWFQLKNNISLIEEERVPDTIRGGNIFFKKNYQAKTDDELKDIYKYDELITIYNKFYQIYKARGDIESANGCYMEMKDVETRRLNFLYRQAPSIKTYFDWKINHFLKFFCDYGTSPAKSLVISFYVILVFAAFYFFFYSDWDKINRSFLIRKYRNMLKYFRSEQKLEDFYTEEHKDEFQSYDNFRKEMEESKVEIPFFFNLIGSPLYHLSLIRHQVMSWLYRRTEILSGRWTDLKPVRKGLVGSTVSLVILVYLINLVFIRSLNSIFLSINTFSTLGFGDIPVKGISRYMAILEGFLGWFLLSIFSVSLISQILKI